jgi:hypothetical protein
MEERNIPYIVYESTLATSERHIKRLIVALVICIALLFISNAAWLYYWSQYDYVSTEESTTYSQDGEGTNIIGSLNELDN